MQDFQRWANTIKEKTGGRIDIELVPVASVVPIPQTLDAMTRGVLAGHYTGSPYFAGKDPAFAIMGDTMAAYENAAQRDRWFDEGGGTALARKLYAQYGVHFVSNVYTPEEWLPSKKELTKLEDLKGLKLRGPGGTVSELFKRAGAGVVELPGTEVFNALQSGAVDAADWGWHSLNERMGIYKIAKFAVYTRHSMGVTEVSFDKKKWDALPAETRDLFERELKAYSKARIAVYQKEDEEATKRAVEAGVKLVRWPASEYEKIQKILLDIWADDAKKSPMAKEMVDSHLAFMKKIGALK
jgi:TRAP-type mannitol/chloroaromatic compound transport system substrate-binding protein